MPTDDQAWVAAEEAKRQWMAENGLYAHEDEHSSCGVGLVVSIDGTASRGVVENGINASAVASWAVLGLCLAKDMLWGVMVGVAAFQAYGLLYPAKPKGKAKAA